MVSYIPKNFPAAGEGILILAARGETAEDYLEKKDFWRQYAEKRNAVIIILEAAEEGWRQRELQKDVDFLDAVLLFLCQKEWYCVNEASIYLYGIGDGAYTAAAYSLAKPEKIAAFATWGTAKLHPDLLEQIRNKKSIARPELKNADYPVAAWMIRETGEDAPTAEYIKSTLRGGEEKIVSDKAQIYLQNAKRFPRTIMMSAAQDCFLAPKSNSPMDRKRKRCWIFCYSIGGGSVRRTDICVTPEPRRTWDLPYTGVNIRDCIAITTCMSPAATGTASEARDR